MHLASLTPRVASFGRGFAALSLIASLSFSPPACAAAGPAIPVNVGLFTGPDQRLTHTVSEILIADLSRSQRLAVLDGRHRISSGAHVGYTVVGSCLPERSAVLINLRIVSAASGRSIPGAAESIEGPRAQLFALAHRLAARFSNRLASLPAPVWTAAAPAMAASPRLAATIETGVPAHVRPASAFVDEDIADRMERERIGGEGDGRLSPRDDGRPALRENVEHVERTVHYTGVIIDAHGLGLNRSMSPKLRRKDGTVVWDGANADPDYVIDEGVVSYADTLDKARQGARAGSNPLIIVAAGRYEQPFPSDPLLTDDDADLLQRAGAHDGFLKKFRVIVVTGP